MDNSDVDTALEAVVERHRWVVAKFRFGRRDIGLAVVDIATPAEIEL